MVNLSIFDDVRRLVSAREVAELNGLHPNRSGYICCPFHSEKTPSLKFYQDGGWKCFGCGKGGNGSIDFVAALYDMTPLDAVRRLNDDFRLNLPVDRQQTPSERREAEQAAQRRREISATYWAFQTWRTNMLQQLNTAYRTGHLAIMSDAPLDKLTDAESIAVRWQAVIESWSDALMSEDMTQQMEIFRERRVIQSRIDQILNRTLRKSGAA